MKSLELQLTERPSQEEFIVIKGELNTANLQKNQLEEQLKVEQEICVDLQEKGTSSLTVEGWERMFWPAKHTPADIPTRPNPAMISGYWLLPVGASKCRKCSVQRTICGITATGLMNGKCSFRPHIFRVSLWHLPEFPLYQNIHGGTYSWVKR